MNLPLMPWTCLALTFVTGNGCRHGDRVSTFASVHRSFIAPALFLSLTRPLCRPYTTSNEEDCRQGRLKS